MKRLLLASAVLCMLAALAPATASAETHFVYTPADGSDPYGVAARAERAERVRAAIEARKESGAERPGLIERGPAPEDRHILPYYFVDSDALGETTLLAIRSSASGVGTVTLRYYGLSFTDGPARTDTVELDPQEVYTRNLRDVAGLPLNFAGNKEGFVLIDFPNGNADLGADSFRIDIGQNFATGSQLMKGSDLCFIRENRFLEGGPIDGGTEMVLLINSPQGGDIDNDDPSAILQMFAEDGTFLGTISVYSSINVVALPLDGFTFGELFGAVETEFIGGVGFTTVTYSASNKYSIGISGRCLPTPL